MRKSFVLVPLCASIPTKYWLLQHRFGSLVGLERLHGCGRLWTLAGYAYSLCGSNRLGCLPASKAHICVITNGDDMNQNTARDLPQNMLQHIAQPRPVELLVSAKCGLCSEGI